jgi:antitoxin MazE
MRRRVRKWGNSLAITIPTVLAREVGLRQNSEVELVIENRSLVVTRVPSYTLDELLRPFVPRIFTRKQIGVPR